ncbi:MAG: cell division protein ZipA [Candidatus Reddybacter sp.]
MELGGREILIALGALLIVAILLDGFRRVRRAGEGKLRVKRRKQPIFEGDDLDEFGSELPGGGARVVAFRDEDSAEELSQSIKANREHDASRVTAPFRQAEPVAPGFEKNTPLAESPEWEDESELLAAEPVMDQIIDTEPDSEEARRESQISLFAEASGSNDQEDDFCASAFAAEDREPVESIPTKPVKKSRKSRASKKKTSQDNSLKSRPSKNKAAQEKSTSESLAPDIAEDDVVILHLMAEQGEVFQGDELLKTVVNNGLRYGSLKIFHRHVREDGSGDVLFSMANSVNPGTFELNSMGSFSTPGVTFMMVMEDSEDPLGTFDLMLECIHGVNSTIGGELKDQQRSALSQQTAEHYRQRIMDFNRRRLAAGV